MYEVLWTYINTCTLYSNSTVYFLLMFITTECSQTPYLCIAEIGKVQYANGKGRSKKTAKKAAGTDT